MNETALSSTVRRDAGAASASWAAPRDLLSDELDPGAFVALLQQLADSSRAVRHPLLDAIAHAKFSSPQQALRRFFREYYVYSRRFTRYLGALMANLEQPAHRAALLHNSSEEAGQLEAAHCAELSAAGIDPEHVKAPHPQLFERFLTAIEAAPTGLAEEQPHLATSVWVETFEALCRSSEGAAVGALGIATEGVVRGMYLQLLAGIRLAFPSLGMRDRVFFELHARVDDDHAEALRSIACDLAISRSQRRALAVGVVAALAARASFYDAMQEYLYAADAVTPCV